MNTWLCIRLGLAALSFGMALMSVAPAPTVWLFKLSVGAMEFGHWLLLLPLALLFLGPWQGALEGAAVGLSLAACILFLYASFRAQRFARMLPARFATAFPASQPSSKEPFAWRRLWFAPRGARAKVEVREFTTDGPARLNMHFYHSAGQQPAPCVIVIHGGGWEGGSPGEFAAFNHELARRGYAVAAMQYRFAPQWRWPAQQDDVLAAIRWLKENASALGIDSQKLVLMGRSAGGQIAAAVAYSAHDPAIRGCIAFYAPADMHFGHKYAREDDIIRSLGLVLNYMGGPPAEVRAIYDSASPILLAGKDAPPTLMLHGRRDTYVWYLQSIRLSARLRELGVPHFHLDLPWATHGFDYNPHGPGGQLAAYAVLRFLKSVTQ